MLSRGQLLTRALEPSKLTGIAELIIVFTDDLFKGTGCGLLWRTVNAVQGLGFFLLRQDPGQAPFCYTSVLVPVGFR